VRAVLSGTLSPEYFEVPRSTKMPRSADLRWTFLLDLPFVLGSSIRGDDGPLSSYVTKPRFFHMREGPPWGVKRQCPESLSSSLFAKSYIAPAQVQGILTLARGIGSDPRGELVRRFSSPLRVTTGDRLYPEIVFLVFE